MQLRFDEQTEAFRAEFSAWLDEHTPDEATALAERSRSTAVHRATAARLTLAGARPSEVA